MNEMFTKKLTEVCKQYKCYPEYEITRERPFGQELYLVILSVRISETKAFSAHVDKQEAQNNAALTMLRTLAELGYDTKMDKYAPFQPKPKPKIEFKSPSGLTGKLWQCTIAYEGLEVTQGGDSKKTAKEAAMDEWLELKVKILRNLLRFH